MESDEIGECVNTLEEALNLEMVVNQLKDNIERKLRSLVTELLEASTLYYPSILLSVNQAKEKNQQFAELFDFIDYKIQQLFNELNLQND